MQYVRGKLKECSPELYETLERNWEIAFDEWLPALDAKNDSFNSYPHLRNLESHLDDIVAAFEARREGNKPFFASAIEMYAMLAAILFHDIGKIYSNEGHGGKSAEVVRDNRAELGIPSDAIADAIAKVCDFHDTKPDSVAEKLIKTSTVLIDPYGEVRERCLAVMLYLVDHLDSSFLRAIPNYLIPLEDKKIVGAFRSVVQGVSVDLEGQFVRAELGEMPRDAAKGKETDHADWLRVVYSPQWSPDTIIPEYWKESREYLQCAEDTKIVDPSMSFGALPEKYGAKILQKILLGEIKETPRFLEMIMRKHLRVSKVKWSGKEILDLDGEKSGKLDKSLRGEINTIVDGDKYGILRESPASAHGKGGHDRSEPEKELEKELCERVNALKDRHIKWPRPLILAMLLGDIRENNASIAPIRSALFALGIPVREWLIEYKEHLYTDTGEETFEPIFNREYLLRTVDCMWQLSTGIFGESLFSYRTLASQLREGDEKKVRLAVRRVGIVANSFAAEEKSESSAIWVGLDGWKWVVGVEKKKGGPAEDKPKKCDFFHVLRIKKLIDDLTDPEAGK
jgi:hypothetical protein